MRIMHLKPIEGVLLQFEGQDKFPHRPDQSYELEKITAVELMNASKWYFKRALTYMRVEIEGTDHIFCSESRDEIICWIDQIRFAVDFHLWIKSLLEVRIILVQNGISECVDRIIQPILQLSIPEVDMD